MPHELIVSIVSNGRGEDVVEAAQKGGASGATMFQGRGSGVQKLERFYNLNIEPEKEVIFIIAEQGESPAIIRSIQKSIDLDAPNSGIIFTLDITSAAGLYRDT